jgi:DNA polymerase III epsilon subunit-like protein
MAFKKGINAVVFLDIETGGLGPLCPIIELAAVAVQAEDFVELAAMHTRIEFDVTWCEPEALEINHYDPELWEGAPNTFEAMEHFNSWLEPFACIEMRSRNDKPYYLARTGGHNVTHFDLPRIVAAMDREELFPQFDKYKALDTLARAVWWFAETGNEPPPSFSLGALTERLWIEPPPGEQHTALHDALLATELARNLTGKTVFAGRSRAPGT